MRIFFDAKVARYVRRRRWHPTEQITGVRDGIELTMEVTGDAEVVSWVLGFGDKARVLEPGDLRERVARELRAAVAQYAE